MSWGATVGSHYSPGLPEREREREREEREREREQGAVSRKPKKENFQWIESHLNKSGGL